MNKVKKNPHAGMSGNAREFVKIVHGLARSRSHREVFDDFLELAFCAIAKTTYPPGHERADALEARYMETVGKRDPDYIRELPKLLAITSDAHTGGDGGDFLGHVSGELGALNEHAGQFFTPFEVAKLLANATLAGCEEIVERNGFVTIHEPACGAGGMILAAADVMEGLGLDPTLHLFAQAIDVSSVAFRMTYLQLALRGIPADVIHANTLTLEQWGGEITPAKHAFVAHHGDRWAAWRRGKAPEKPATMPAADSVQLDFLGAL